MTTKYIHNTKTSWQGALAMWHLTVLMMELVN